VVDGDRLEMPAAAFLRRAAGRLPLIWIGLRAPLESDGWSSFLNKPFLMKDLYGAVQAALESAAAKSTADSA